METVPLSPSLPSGREALFKEITSFPNKTKQKNKHTGDVLTGPRESAQKGAKKKFFLSIPVQPGVCVLLCVHASQNSRALAEI